MQTKNGPSLSYEDFEPFCNWRRNDESETLVLHVPAFKKEQLKIQVTTADTVRISGERLVDATKRSRFVKEIAIPKDCEAKDIHAKFSGGLLHVVMPKKGPPAVQQELTQKINQDQATESPPLSKPDHAPEKIASADQKMLPAGKVGPEDDDDDDLCDFRPGRLPKTAMNVAAVVAAVACLGAYLMYSYRHLYIDQD